MLKNIFSRSFRFYTYAVVFDLYTFFCSLFTTWSSPVADPIAGSVMLFTLKSISLAVIIWFIWFVIGVIFAFFKKVRHPTHELIDTTQYSSTLKKELLIVVVLLVGISMFLFGSSKFNNNKNAQIFQEQKKTLSSNLDEFQGSHGIRLVDTLTVNLKKLSLVYSFVLPSGKFGYSGNGAVFFDGKEISDKNGTYFKEVDGKLAYMVNQNKLIYDGKEVFSLGYDDNDFQEVNGKLVYSTYKVAKGNKTLVYDGKQILVTQKGGSGSSAFKVVNGDIVYSIPGQTPSTTIIHYDGQEIELEGDISEYEIIGKKLLYRNGHDTYYDGSKLPDTVVAYRDIGGNLAYSTEKSTATGRSEYVLHYNGEQILLGDSAFDSVNFDDIAGKLVYINSSDYVVYDSKELPFKCSSLNGCIRELDDTYVVINGGSVIFKDKTYPFDEVGKGIAGNNQIIEIGDKIFFTTFGFPYDFYYDGKKIGSAKRISDVVISKDESKAYFVTEDVDGSNNTIFSLYEIY